MSYTRADYQAARESVRASVAGGLAVGTHKLVCPLCGGGSSREASLSLTVSDDHQSWAWFCHRASCKFGGRTGTVWHAMARQAPGAFVARPYERDTRPVGPEAHAVWAQRLERALGLNWARLAATAGVTEACDDWRELVFPLWTVAGYTNGHISRRINEDGSRTVRTWRLRPGPVYALYSPQNFGWHWPAKEVWLVEDHLSAMRLAADGQYPAYAVALCGTNLSAELAKELSPLLTGGLPVRVALDPDASAQALEMALWLRNERGVPAWPVLLKADVKDMGAAEYGELRYKTAL